jgi:hypothetical protein
MTSLPSLFVSFGRHLCATACVVFLASAANLSAQTLIHNYAGGEDDGVTAGSFVSNTQDAGSANADMSSYYFDRVKYSASTYGGDSTLAYAFEGNALLYTSTDQTLTNSASFIIELRFNAATLSGDQILIYNSHTSFYGIGLYLSGTSLNLLRGGVGINEVATIETSTWNYAAVVYDAGNTTVYLNDTAYALGTLAFNNPTIAGGLLLGADQVAGAPFNGLIDDVRISTFTNGTFNSSMLSYSAVPEPSTYAAIFGALVLGLTVWRKRRRVSVR